MAEFYVTMPMAGRVTLPVEAENEEEAKEKFYDEFEKLKDGINDPNCDYEWDFYQEMSRGNCRYYPYDQVEVKEA